MRRVLDWRKRHPTFVSLRERLLRSHLGVATIGVALVAFAVAAALYVRAATLRLTSETEPAIRAATRALAGLERATSAMRIWLASGDAAAVAEYELAWTREVTPSLAMLRMLATRWAPGERRWVEEAVERAAEVRAAHERARGAASTAEAAPRRRELRHVRERLVREAAPQARRAGQLLTALAGSAQQRLREDADGVVRAAELGVGILLALLAIGGVVTLAISIRAADRVTAPIAALAAATGALAERTLTRDLPVVRDDEIGALTRTFNRMRASVVGAERALSAQAAEARQAHAALQAEFVERTRAEARFCQLLAATPDPILVVDDRGSVTLANVAAERMFGYRREDLLGAKLDALVPTALEWSRLVAAGSGRGGGEAELLALRRDGGSVPVEISANPLLIDGHTLLAVAMRDVTERHRAAQAQRRLNAELERRVLERTRELRRSNEELERFAAVASHDLQEPLRMVASYTQLLADRYRGRLDADADEFIAYALDGTRRMQRLIRDLLAYARVTTRTRPDELVDAGAILERALANLRLAIAERGAEVLVDPLPRVRVDGSQLGQLLQNLVDNALKHGGTRRPLRVRVAAERRGGEWVFAVADNGAGVSPEDAERIFALFERVRRDPAHPGSGIGLALCKKIVERHGGRIWVEPAAGGGAVFRFTLPAADAEDGEGAGGADGEEGGVAAGARRGDDGATRGVAAGARGRERAWARAAGRR